MVGSFSIATLETCQRHLHRARHPRRCKACRTGSCNLPTGRTTQSSAAKLDNCNSCPQPFGGYDNAIVAPTPHTGQYDAGRSWQLPPNKNPFFRR